MIWLGPSKIFNRLVNDGNAKLRCWGFVLALFQSTAANEIGTEHTYDYTKLFPGMQSWNISSYSK